VESENRLLCDSWESLAVLLRLAVLLHLAVLLRIVGESRFAGFLRFAGLSCRLLANMQNVVNTADIMGIETNSHSMNAHLPMLT
jgi:hypothetical protein